MCDRAVEIVKIICRAAAESEDGNAFNQWIVEHSDEWLLEIDAESEKCQ